MNDDILRDVRVLDFTTIVSGHIDAAAADSWRRSYQDRASRGDFIRTQHRFARAERILRSSKLRHRKVSRSICANLARWSWFGNSRLNLTCWSRTRGRRDAAARPGLRDRRETQLTLVYCSISALGSMVRGDAQRLCADAARGGGGLRLWSSVVSGWARAALNTGIYVGDVLAVHKRSVRSIRAARARAQRSRRLYRSRDDGRRARHALSTSFRRPQVPQKKRANTFQPTARERRLYNDSGGQQNNFEDLARAVGHPNGWLIAFRRRESRSANGRRSCRCSRNGLRLEPPMSANRY